jgi:metallo-beta-lactamase family protein
MLKDSAYINEKEAEDKNRKNQRSGKSFTEPLFTYEDAVAALKQVKPIIYDQLTEVAENVKVIFSDAGHVLGSAILEIFVQENKDISKIVFSGDIGMKDKSILKNPAIIKRADYIIMEATYGNRLHENNTDSVKKLIEIVLTTVRRGGTVIIPSFAVGRTQELIFEFNRFYEDHAEYKKELNDIMVYVDSPMAINATEIFKKNAQFFDKEIKDYILQRNDPLDFKNLKFIRTVEESKELNIKTEPKIIISSSGMCEAGRIRHHLKHNIWNPKTSIVLAGYQAEGTLGRLILEGNKVVSILGEKIQVNAEIHELEGFSGHADKKELLDWISGFETAPKEIFLVHGEKDSKESLALAIKERFNYSCKVLTGITEYIFADKELCCKEELKSIASVIERKQKIRDKIITVRDELGLLLSNTGVTDKENFTSDQITEINDLMIRLEKNTIALASLFRTN